jgi:hypothetical protein
MRLVDSPYAFRLRTHPKVHARMCALTGASLHAAPYPAQHSPGLSGGQHGDHLGQGVECLPGHSCVWV